LPPFSNAPDRVRWTPSQRNGTSQRPSRALSPQGRCGCCRRRSRHPRPWWGPRRAPLLRRRRLTPGAALPVS